MLFRSALPEPALEAGVAPSSEPPSVIEPAPSIDVAPDTQPASAIELASELKTSAEPAPQAAPAPDSTLPSPIAVHTTSLAPDVVERLEKARDDIADIARSIEGLSRALAVRSAQPGRPKRPSRLN